MVSPTPMTTGALAQRISEAFTDREKLKDPAYTAAVRETIDALDRGSLRVAEKRDGAWRVNAWVKEAILLYFAIQPMESSAAGPLHFHDKVPLKTGLDAAGVRVVP